MAEIHFPPEIQAPAKPVKPVASTASATNGTTSVPTGERYRRSIFIKGDNELARGVDKGMKKRPEGEQKPEWVGFSEDLRRRYEGVLKDYVENLSELRNEKDPNNTNQSMLDAILQDPAHAYDKRLLDVLSDAELDTATNKTKYTMSEEKIQRFLKEPRGMVITTQLIEQQAAIKMMAMGKIVSMEPHYTPKAGSGKRGDEAYYTQRGGKVEAFLESVDTPLSVGVDRFLQKTSSIYRYAQNNNRVQFRSSPDALRAIQDSPSEAAYIRAVSGIDVNALKIKPIISRDTPIRPKIDRAVGVARAGVAAADRVLQRNNTYSRMRDRFISDTGEVATPAPLLPEPPILDWFDGDTIPPIEAPVEAVPLPPAAPATRETVVGYKIVQEGNLTPGRNEIELKQEIVGALQLRQQFYEELGVSPSEIDQMPEQRFITQGGLGETTTNARWQNEIDADIKRRIATGEGVTLSESLRLSLAARGESMVAGLEEYIQELRKKPINTATLDAKINARTAADGTAKNERVNRLNAEKQKLQTDKDLVDGDKRIKDANEEAAKELRKAREDAHTKFGVRTIEEIDIALKQKKDSLTKAESGTSSYAWREAQLEQERREEISRETSTIPDSLLGDARSKESSKRTKRVDEKYDLLKTHLKEEVYRRVTGEIEELQTLRSSIQEKQTTASEANNTNETRQRETSESFGKIFDILRTQESSLSDMEIVQQIQELTLDALSDMVNQAYVRPNAEGVQLGWPPERNAENRLSVLRAKIVARAEYTPEGEAAIDNMSNSLGDQIGRIESEVQNIDTVLEREVLQLKAVKAIVGETRVVEGEEEQGGSAIRKRAEQIPFKVDGFTNHKKLKSSDGNFSTYSQAEREASLPRGYYDMVNIFTNYQQSADRNGNFQLIQTLLPPADFARLLNDTLGLKCRRPSDIVNVLTTLNTRMKPDSTNKVSGVAFADAFQTISSRLYANSLAMA